ncbi:Dam family site-specific DNA-(adenine-N6)-methyltransferase [Salmonella enterica]|nr:Dam family site-specific DNA-(adenine-N6)-methyltransferase [Salmonella enterica]EHE3170167.1 Dam family site-specific DNA-(adenine-N6)-methyltransferase [Salmonella enterica]EIR0277895.1 Dam family site-specific DNA-(adenine-N6)-methyltransferase [Salmonella enterica]EKA1639295.1 Dam family site-specific DNA-(adenine-N6)-methyltransferase [Salmonella enterica]ELS1746356.1 Dam family site-specific DNA-(adenine-N6)-methyltransferase [Salmonella enterica]
MRKHTPIIKWAGGKTKLMPFISQHFPHDQSRRWIEPFIGGGAVFLNMFATDALLADSNPDLINLYRIIQRHKPAFIKEVKLLAERHFDKNGYNELRNTFNSTSVDEAPLQRAVLFYAMNRLGYNGLCRYNLKRKYSVPWGKREQLTLDTQKLDYLSFRLSGVELTTADFSQTLESAGGGDQIYCDPPYDKISKTSFVSYDGIPFDKSAHVKLADMLVVAHRKGASVAISNSMTPFTLELYEGRGFEIHILNAYRSVGSQSKSRKKEKELLAVLR